MIEKKNYIFYIMSNDFAEVDHAYFIHLLKPV